MRSVTLLALLATPAVGVAGPLTWVPAPVTGQKLPDCAQEKVHRAIGKRLPGAQKPGDLPPANHYLAIDRRVDGCRRPIVVSTGIGTR